MALLWYCNNCIIKPRNIDKLRSKRGYAPVVQWTEHSRPKGKMRVRFLLGAHVHMFTQESFPHKKTRKKKVISAAILATSFYASVLFTGGLILGYLAMKLFYNKYVKDDSSKFMYVSIKGWKIHLHHWIPSALIIVYLLLGGWQLGAHEIFVGILCGIAVHDIYDFNDWHQIIARDRKTA